MMARRTRCSSAALKDGPLIGEQWRALTRAAGELSELDLRLVSCGASLDSVSAAVRAVFAKPDAFLIVDASHEPSARTNEIRAELLRAVIDGRSRAVVVIDGTVE
jgi:hypothetical protein